MLKTSQETQEVTAKEVQEMFGGKLSKYDADHLLHILRRLGVAGGSGLRKTKGRPAKIWRIPLWIKIEMQRKT